MLPSTTCFFLFFTSAALRAVTPQSVSRARARVRAQGTRCLGEKRTADSRRRTGREMPFSFFCLLLLCLLFGVAAESESRSLATGDATKIIDAPAGKKGSVRSFPSSLRRGKRALPAPSCSRGLDSREPSCAPEEGRWRRGQIRVEKVKKEKKDESSFFFFCFVVNPLSTRPRGPPPPRPLPFFFLTTRSPPHITTKEWWSRSA